MGGYDLGQVYGRIVLDASGVASGINAARQALNTGFANMGSSLQSFGDQLTGVGARITALTAPFTAFSASGVKVAADFDVLMKQIELFGGVTGEELESVRQYALQMGADTKFSAQDAGEALLELLKSGMDLNTAIATLPDVLNLAAVGEMSLGEAAGIASGGLAAFKLDASGLTAELERLETRYGITKEQFDKFAIDGSIADGLLEQSNQLGITREDWSDYWASLFTDVESVNPAIQQLVDATGINATHIMELVSGTYKEVADPSAFIALQNQLGITDAMFTEWLDEDGVAPQAIVDMAEQLGVAVRDIGGMWANTKTVTPELKALGEQLGITGEQWEALRVDMVDNFAGEGSIQITDAMRQMSESTGLSVSHLMGLFTEKVGDSTRVVNALAQAANASRADVRDLGAALGNVGPIANTYGLDIEETSAILGVFANNTIMGAEAGTQLKSMLQNMTRTTDDVKGAWDELGVSFYDSNGNVRDFNTVIVELDSALANLPIEKQNEYVQRLGGSFGSMGLTALLASDGIGDMLAEMEKAPESGALAESFMNTFAGKVEGLKGSFETLKIQALTPFMNEVLGPLVDRMTLAINAVTQWAGENPELTVSIMQIGSAIALAGPGLMAAGLAISNIGFAIKTVAPFVGLLTSPFGLIAGAGLVLAKVFNVDLKKAFEDTIAVVMPALQGLYTWFVEEALPEIIDFVETTVIPIFEDIGKTIEDVWNFIAPILAQLYVWFVSTAMPALEGIGNIFREIWETVAPILGFLINWFVTTGIPIIVGIIEGVIVPAIGVLVNVLSSIWNAVAPALQILIDWFQTTGWPLIEGIINNVITPAINFLVGVLKGIWEIAGPVINELVNWFSSVIEPVITTATSFVTTAINAFVAIFTGIWTTIQESLKNIENWFNTTIAPVIDAAREKFIKPAIDKIVEIFTAIWKWAEPGLNQLRDGMRPIFDAIGKIVGTVVSAILGIPDAIKRAQDAINLFNGNAEIIKQTQQAAINSGMGSKDVEDLAYAEVSDAFGGGILGNLAAGILAPGITNQALSGRNQQIGNLVAGSVNYLIPPMKDNGGEGLAMMPYLIGKPQEDNEIFVPRTSGQFIPNFMEKLELFMNQGQQGVTIETVVIHANDAQGGRSAGDAFVQRLKQLERAGGG